MSICPQCKSSEGSVGKLCSNCIKRNWLAQMKKREEFVDCPPESDWVYQFVTSPIYHVICAILVSGIVLGFNFSWGRSGDSNELLLVSGLKLGFVGAIAYQCWIAFQLILFGAIFPGIMSLFCPLCFITRFFTFLRIAPLILIGYFASIILFLYCGFALGDKWNAELPKVLEQVFFG